MEKRVPCERPVKMEVQNQEILGDRLFALRKYKEAIERFDKSLERKENARNLQYRVYNKKAHAYLKLRDYDEAIKAAAQSIRLGECNADGYLLAANALMNKKKFERAISLLEAGLTKVQKNGTKWNKINKNLDESRANVTLYSKRRDFLDSTEVNNFPMELVFNIFGYLGQKDVLRCEQVSKRWKTVIRSNPQFYQSLEINDRIPAESLNRWLNLTEKSPFKLQHLGFKLSLDTDYELQCFYERKKYLLNVAGATKQLESERLQIEPRIPGRLVHRLYPHGSNTLTKLVLDGVGKLCLTDVEVMIKNLPVLEHAEFHCVSKPRDGVVLQWTPPLPNLKTIHIIGARGEHNDMPETLLGLNKLIKSAPNVTEAVFNDFGKSAVWAKAHEFADWKFLEKLDLRKLRMTKLPTLPSSLRHLCLSDIATVAYFELEHARIGVIDVSSYDLPSLVSLDVEGSDFTHFACRLANGGLTSGSLKALKMGDTFHITAQDDPYRQWPQGMLASSGQLLKLSLKSLSHVREDIIIQVLDQYPNLLEVDLSGCDITGSTIKHLFRRAGEVGPPNLLDVRSCAKVGRDAIEAARETGCAVYSDYKPLKQVYLGIKHPVY